MTKTNGNGGGGTTIHISLQVEGGVGKSSIYALLSQYFREYWDVSIAKFRPESLPSAG